MVLLIQDSSLNIFLHNFVTLLLCLLESSVAFKSGSKSYSHSFVDNLILLFGHLQGLLFSVLCNFM